MTLFCIKLTMCMINIAFRVSESCKIKIRTKIYGIGVINTECGKCMKINESEKIKLFTNLIVLKIKW